MDLGIQTGHQLENTVPYIATNFPDMTQYFQPDITTPHISPGIQSLGMQQGNNFSTMIPGQNLGYQQFPQSQQPSQQ